MIPIQDLGPGKVVRLNSGSPKMTVERVTRGGRRANGDVMTDVESQVELIWHHDRLGMQRCTVSPELLTWPAPSAPRAPSDSEVD